MMMMPVMLMMSMYVEHFFEAVGSAPTPDVGRVLAESFSIPCLVNTVDIDAGQDVVLYHDLAASASGNKAPHEIFR